MARVLILRQRPEAEETAARIRALGHEPVVLPLAETVPLRTEPPAGAFSGFVATSLQATPALAAAFPGDERPVLCTGARTRQAMVEAGFAAAEAGPGTAEGLGRRIRDLARESGLPLLYAAGRVRRPGLEEAVGPDDLVVWEVYDTRPVHPGMAETAGVFTAGGVDHALLLSAGQAAGFSALWRDIGDGRAVPTLLCLSERISRALSADLRPFARISPQPTLSSLFDRHLPPSFGYGGGR